MSSSLSKSFHLSSSLKEEVMENNQGIVSILGNGFEALKSSSSLRRTLSADMSSKLWQIHHGLGSPLTKITSSQHLCDTKINEFETNEEKTGRLDIWSSILTQKAEEDKKNLPPPYTHPLVKRSSSSLSEKSLRICTESLGSETGSDGCCFSSYPSSESTSDSDERAEEEKATQKKYDADDYDHFHVVKYNNSTKKTMLPRSFPPPIASLSSRAGGSIRMNSYRENGRLVLEAVSAPPQNNFRAQREDGRLVLTFVNSPAEEQEYGANEDQFDMEMERFEEEETEDKAEVEEDPEDCYESASKLEQEAPKFRNGMPDFHKLAFLANKRVVLANRNITTSWSNKYSKMVDFEFEEKVAPEPIKPLIQSLPPRPPVVPRMVPSSPKGAAVSVAAAASVNRYDYYWKPETLTGTTKNCTAAKDQQKQREMGAVQMLKSCKEPRRSLLYMEPHCIATS